MGGENDAVNVSELWWFGKDDVLVIGLIGFGFR
jgi:hypothetical protein